jgi:hypothetical protein
VAMYVGQVGQPVTDAPTIRSGGIISSCDWTHEDGGREKGWIIGFMDGWIVGSTRPPG